MPCKRCKGTKIRPVFCYISKKSLIASSVSSVRYSQATNHKVDPYIIYLSQLLPNIPQTIVSEPIIPQLSSNSLCLRGHELAPSNQLAPSKKATEIRGPASSGVFGMPCVWFLDFKAKSGDNWINEMYLDPIFFTEVPLGFGHTHKFHSHHKGNMSSKSSNVKSFQKSI